MASRPVVVWDAAVRVSHWLVVALVAAAYVTMQMNWIDWHLLAGEALLGLVIFRLLWGVFGSDTARFQTFIASPMKGLRNLAQIFRREPDERAGHNAAGGWSIMLLLALLLGETLTGLYVNNEIADEGPLTAIVPAPVANAITALHGILWNALLVAIALHLLAIATYAIAKRQDLVRPMLTGRKSLPSHIPIPFIATTARALLLLSVSAAVAALIATWL